MAAKKIEMAKILSRLFTLRALHTFKMKDLNSSCYTITRALSAQALQEDLERTPLLHYSPPPTQAWIRSFNSGDKLGIIDLDPRVFGSRPRIDILQRVVVWQLAKKRAGTAKVKDRGEVRGGGRKPRQQKGSGRARQGSIRAPHYVGGGVVHGPRGPVSYDYTLPKKVRKLGLRSALSIKYAQGDLQIVDALSCDSHKTRDFVEMMAARDWTSVLLVDGGDVNSDLCMATQNLEKADVLPSIGLNVYSVLSRETLVMSVGAVRMIEQRLTMDFCDPLDNVLEDSVD